MVDPVDKPAGPEGKNATSPTGGGVAGQEQSQQSTPDTEAQIRELNETLGTMRKQFDNQRSLHDRQMNELRRQNAPPPTPPQYVAPGQPEEAVLVQQINQEFQSRDQTVGQLEYQTAINSFKVDNPNWNEDWTEMNRILQDDSEVQRVAVYDPNGRVDYGKTLSYTRSLVRDSRLSAAQQSANAQRADLEAARATQKEQAVISGSSGYALPEGIAQEDISKMTPREMIEKGIFPTDRNDPPVFDE